jgi:hypothetical protein
MTGERKYMLDVTTEWGQHAEQRLRTNIFAWLTTVGSTPESMAANFSVGIRVTPTKFRSWA